MALDGIGHAMTAWAYLLIAAFAVILALVGVVGWLIYGWIGVFVAIPAAMVVWAITNELFYVILSRRRRRKAAKELEALRRKSNDTNKPDTDRDFGEN